MEDLKQVNKSASITVRLSKSEAESIKNQAAAELLSISSLLRRKLFFTPLKATI